MLGSHTSNLEELGGVTLEEGEAAVYEPLGGGDFEVRAAYARRFGWPPGSLVRGANERDREVNGPRLEVRHLHIPLAPGVAPGEGVLLLVSGPP